MKKILSLLLIALMAIGVNAGNGNRTVTGAPYKVGDYYNDGTKEGIVFQVSDDGMHGKIVSLDESKNVPWAVEGVIENNATGATSGGDGMSNMNKIRMQPDWKTNYPAFAWCASLGNGWYLPAVDELNLIDENRGLINQGLKKGAYDEISDDVYWSSTESEYVDCAWGVNMYDGDTDDYYKYDGNYVRAVSVF